MRGRFVVLLLLAGGFLVGGLLLTLLQRSRAAQSLVYSVNNVRELSQFALLSGAEDAQRARGTFPADPKFKPTPLDRFRELNVAAAVPAGTVFRPELPPDQRLSWIAPLLPTFNQSRQDTVALFGELDLSRPWDAEPNKSVARVPLRVLTSYAAPQRSNPNEPAGTQFVGIGGVGTDAPTLPLGADLVADPRAGCFRYDGLTPFAAVADGLSQTLLLGEVSTDLGPWLRGGAATVRTLDTGPGARPVIGVGGQFGGNHLAGGIFGLADHGVRVLTPRTDPQFLANLCTIRGGTAEHLPGE